MPSRQDQLHSYQFMVQRVVGALVQRETDPAQSPFRRAAGATLASVLIALILIGGSVVYGLFVGGGATKWKDPKVVIVEKESGAQYVYYEEKLHLVLNYASALLIVDNPQPKTVSVSRKSLEGAPRGVPLGIPDAPESLAPANRLNADPWTVCSAPRAGSGPQPAQSALLIGEKADGGRALGEQGLLAQHPDQSLYLIWQNRRHLIRDRTLVLNALTWNSARPVAVAPALLNALPAGADLARIPIADQGEPSEAVQGAEIGEVFLVERVGGGGGQYVVARRDGLANITELQASLLLADLRQDDPTEMTLARYAAIDKVASPVPDDEAAAPESIPDLATAEGNVVCADAAENGGVREVRTGASLPDLSGVAGTTARSPQGGGLADHVLVTPGRGAVVEAAAAPGASGGALSIITDLGRRHPVMNTQVLATLGYGNVKPVRIAASLVALVPDGAALDPAAARRAAVQD
ncbi:type VII secretion protein EccB [Plantactinospora sp. CA-290183]|uniref:type VII secretion protein EccB n=1 Tax=Plantactinospora sp. CA-290183 TaxID=3240006 RepID=UPI003D8D922F